jgi:uncharacterized protein (DUF362 family)
MSEKMSRRSFIKTSAAIGASSLIGGNVIAGCGKKNSAATKSMKDLGISVVKGEDYFKNALKAVLANPQRNNPGAFTNPEIVRAAIQMCKKAGAKDVACISQLADENWEKTGLKKVVTEEGAKLVIVDRADESQFKTVPIPKGIALKEA